MTFMTYILDAYCVAPRCYTLIIQDWKLNDAISS